MFSAARNATSVMFLPFYEPDEEHSHTTHTPFGNQTQDGKLVYTNPYAEMVSGFKKSSSSMMTSQVELTHTFENALEGLVLSGIFNLKRDSYYDLQRGFVPFYYAPSPGCPTTNTGCSRSIPTTEPNTSILTAETNT